MNCPSTCSCPGKVSRTPSEEAILDIIVQEVSRALHSPGTPRAQAAPAGSRSIPLGVSNRHAHLTPGTFRMLFGPAAKFEQLRPLYQPGEFASTHTLTIVGPKLRSIPALRILGPLRKYDQVEISLTDAVFLGISPPVVNSGSVKDAAPLTLVGPAGSVYLEHCAIIASRHIHMTSADAARLGVRDGDVCRIRVTGAKSTVFENVLIRVNDAWLLQAHLDTDDANAADVRSDTTVEFLGRM